MVLLSDIQRRITGRIYINEPLATYTSFGVGGSADYCVVPTSQGDLVQAITWLRESSLPFVLLVHGSNLLVSDEGYRGAALMLEPGLTHLSCERFTDAYRGGLVRAEAGVRLGTFVEYCVNRSLRGTEVLAGTRGTVGGWVAKNFGRRENGLADCIFEVDVFRNGKTERLKQGNAGSPEGSLDPLRGIVLAATFRLAEGDMEEVMKARRERLVEYITRQPVNLAHAGGIFKDPPGQKAAELIENAGLGSRRHGGAKISETNANFIVVDVKAKAFDVLALIETIQQKVMKEFHVLLELKVKLIGFERQKLQKVA